MKTSKIILSIVAIIIPSLFTQAYNQTPKGILNISLSEEETPRGTDIPFNALSVPFTTLKVSASTAADVEISKLVFTRIGLGKSRAFGSLWIEIEGYKIGPDRRLDSKTDKVTFRFNPPLVVPAGDNYLIDVVASLNPTSPDIVGQKTRFILDKKSDITSTAKTITGTFPIEGEEMKIADYEVGQLHFTPQGETSLFKTKTTRAELGKFHLQNKTLQNKGIELLAITFKNRGDLELEDLAKNFALYESGKIVSKDYIIDGDYLSFPTEILFLKPNETKDFSIIADIFSVKDSGIVQFEISNMEDVVAVEVGTGFGASSTAGTTTNGCEIGISKAERKCARLKTKYIGEILIKDLPFSDVDIEKIEGRSAIEMFNRSVINGFPDGEFKGDRFVNRAELSKILLLAKNIKGMDNFHAGFPDVTDTAWYAPYVTKAADMGIINGYPDGYFRPEQTVNTAEFLKMFSKTFEIEENLPYSFEDVSDNDWFATFAGSVQKYFLFTNRSSSVLDPNREMTRNEVVVALYQFFKQ